MKKPICSSARIAVPPTAAPGVNPAQACPMTAPSADHAPPSTAATPGRISSQSRPDVYDHADSWGEGVGEVQADEGHQNVPRAEQDQQYAADDPCLSRTAG